MTCTDLVCGTGGWTGPLPGDPDNNVILRAKGIADGIQVSWSYPTLNPHAVIHTILRRGTTDLYEASVEQAIVSGNKYIDLIPVEEFRTYYYWIQIISVNGTPGEPIGPATAYPADSIEQVIERMTGKINETVLADSLRSSIDRIGVVATELTAESQARLAGTEIISAALAEVQSDIGQAMTYVQQEIIQRRDADSALVNSVNVLAAGMEGNTAAITEEQAVRAAADSALALQIETAQTTLGDDIASAQTTLQTNINTVDGKVQAIGARWTAKVDVNGLVGGFGVYNDGTSVDAGFDVDTFWIGKSTTKKKPFIVSGQNVYIDNAFINQLTADKIDSRGLSIKDTQGNVILAAGNALDWTYVGGVNKPADGATRNVFRGDWVSGTSYGAGDIVLRNGNGWSCLVSHVASSTIMPPSLGTSNTYWTQYTVKGDSGIAAVSVVLSNEAHTLPASSTGDVSSYIGSGTTIQVFEGTVALSASATATTSAFRIGTISQLPVNTLTVGAVSYSGTTATIANHSAMLSTTDSVAITIPITVYRADGSSLVINRIQSLTKSKAGVIGVDGAPGPQGPAVVVTPNRASTFTSTDGTLDASQADLIFTARVSGISSPTYVWSFAGLQTNPTASTTSSQTVTSAQFGTSKAATVTCTVNGAYVDVVSIVRLEKSTAAAGATKNVTYVQATAPTGTSVLDGDTWVDTVVVPYVTRVRSGGQWVLAATVGASFDPTSPAAIQGQISESTISTFIANAAITTAQIKDASITTAKIGAAQITNALLQDASITAAKIANAAITSAKIGDAAITSAKIGDAQVNTLQIAGNAVTVPVIVTAPSKNYNLGNELFSNNNWITLATIYIDLTGGGSAILFACSTVTVGGSFISGLMYVTRILDPDGIVITMSGCDGGAPTIIAQGTKTGTYTVQLAQRSANSITISNIYFAALRAKR